MDSICDSVTRGMDTIYERIIREVSTVYELNVGERDISYEFSDRRPVGEERAYVVRAQPRWMKSQQMEEEPGERQRKHRRVSWDGGRDTIIPIASHKQQPLWHCRPGL